MLVGYVFTVCLISDLIVVVLCRADASCNEEEVNLCRITASTTAVDSCVSKQYEMFTHVCTVTGYRGPVVHCCCQLTASSLLCCRYQQSVTTYRCIDRSDAIVITSSRSLKLIAVPVCLLLLLFVIVTIVVLLYRRKAMKQSVHEASHYCCCVAASQHVQPEPTTVTTVDVRSIDIDRHEAARPFLPCLQRTCDDSAENSQLINTQNSEAALIRLCVEPSAPPLDCSTDQQQQQQQQQPLMPCYYCSCNHQCDILPPSYDESLSHRLLFSAPVITYTSRPTTNDITNVSPSNDGLTNIPALPSDRSDTPALVSDAIDTPALSSDGASITELPSDVIVTPPVATGIIDTPALSNDVINASPSGDVTIVTAVPVDAINTTVNK